MTSIILTNAICIIAQKLNSRLLKISRNITYWNIDIMLEVISYDLCICMQNLYRIVRKFVRIIIIHKFCVTFVNKAILPALTHK